MLAPLDEVTQAIINALQACESNNVVDVVDCNLESQSIPDVPCEQLGESACAKDERCQVVRASLVDEAAQCRGPVQFAASHRRCPLRNRAEWVTVDGPPELKANKQSDVLN